MTDRQALILSIIEAAGEDGIIVADIVRESGETLGLHATYKEIDRMDGVKHWTESSYRAGEAGKPRRVVRLTRDGMVVLAAHRAAQAVLKEAYGSR